MEERDAHIQKTKTNEKRNTLREGGGGRGEGDPTTTVEYARWETLTHSLTLLFHVVALLPLLGVAHPFLKAHRVNPRAILRAPLSDALPPSPLSTRCHGKRREREREGRRRKWERANNGFCRLITPFLERTRSRSAG